MDALQVRAKILGEETRRCGGRECRCVGDETAMVREGKEVLEGGQKTGGHEWTLGGNVERAAGRRTG